MKRPYVVYKEGSVEFVGGDPVPAWLNDGCVYRAFCESNLEGLRDSRDRSRFPEHRG